MTNKHFRRLTKRISIAVFAGLVLANMTSATTVENPDGDLAGMPGDAKSNPTILAVNKPVSGEAMPTKLLVFPRQIELTTNRDSQSVVCQLVYANGITRDVTHESEWSIANPELVRRSSNLLYPILDGETQLTISIGEFAVDVPHQGNRRGDSSSDQLQERRDACVCKIRMQFRELPRCGPRQRRISTFAFRI